MSDTLCEDFTVPEVGTMFKIRVDDHRTDAPIAGSRNTSATLRILGWLLLLVTWITVTMLGLVGGPSPPRRARLRRRMR
jgi:hypothetical protein